jgi:alpha-tubulin suppressor-like RCC1 family protein
LFTWGSGYKGKLGHSESWSHADEADEKIPRLVEVLTGTHIEEVHCGGIHTAVVDNQRTVYTFGCGSGIMISLIIDGRLGHPESDNHTYLYKESVPRAIKNLKVISMSCSYYHNIAIGIA